MCAATPATADGSPTLTLPGFEAPVSLSLSPALSGLRANALALHQQPRPPLPEVTLADAAAWTQHTEEEDWLVWRGRWVAARLQAIPFELTAGETLVGVPRFRDPSPEEEPALVAARKTLQTCPPFPGGDAGHFHPDFEKLFAVGVGGLQQEIVERRAALEADDERQPFYQACGLAAAGLETFLRRAAEACDARAGEAPTGASHWRAQAALCRRIATDPPTTFHEALQLMFLVEVALWVGEDHSLTAPGRMDQTLRRFYEADLAAGRLTVAEALELIECLFIQLNRLLWPGSAISVLVGGCDRDGNDVTNDLTYLCLVARLATRLVYPTVGVVWHRGMPDELRDFCVSQLARGAGDPAFFNGEVIAEGLRRRGVAEGECHDFMNSTCVEIKVVGASNIWVAQPYFNLPQGLLDVLEGVGSGALPEPDSFETLCELVRQRLSQRIAEAAHHLHHVWEERGRTGGFPLASCVINDCLQRGLDFDRGGARYNWVENSCVGLANLADSLAALRRLVYDTEELSLTELHTLLQADFVGHEDLRQRLLTQFPHYGNDDDEVDALAAEWARFLLDTTEAHTVGLSPYCPGFFCWIQHERLGSQTGATPDGRHAGFPLADGAGAAQGRESTGPTASVLSTTKWPHVRALGGLVQNLRLSSRLFQTADGRAAVRDTIETYLSRGGFELQVNVVSRETLLAAQQHPEQYQDLLVRVAGYSDYFVHLNKNMQAEILARTEHAAGG